MRFAICNETFGDQDWSSTCHLVAETGYDGIEIAPFTLAEDVRPITPHTRRVLAHTAQRAGLEVVGLHWLLVSPPGLSMTDPEQTIRCDTAEYLAALVDFCADLGGNIVTLGSPAQRRIPDGDSTEQATERLLTTLEPALSRCEKHHITLCLEPLPSPEADLVLTLEEAVVLVKRVAHPFLKTIFDVKSASSENKPLVDLIRRYAPYLAHVHANDANRRGPGFGPTDFVPILSALHEIDYAGFVSVEVFDYSPDPLTIARDSLTYLKRCQPRLEGKTPL